MPVDEGLYVLAPGESADESDGWVRPRPLEEAVENAIATETDLTADDLDDVESYVDLDDLESLLDGERDDETMTFGVEGHDLVVDAGGHVEEA